MGINWNDGGYSSRVELFVIINGERIPVAKLGSDSFVLREPRSLSHGDAQLLISIDGREEQHEIVLNPCDPAAREVFYW
jgi:hypothetical protein